VCIFKIILIIYKASIAE